MENYSRGPGNFQWEECCEDCSVLSALTYSLPKHVVASGPNVDASGAKAMQENSVLPTAFLHLKLDGMEIQ